MSTWILPQIFSRKIVRLIKEPTIPSFLGVFAVLSPKIVRFLENSPMPFFLCDFATLREIFFGCGSAALSLCVRFFFVQPAGPPRDGVALV